MGRDMNHIPSLSESSGFTTFAILFLMVLPLSLMAYPRVDYDTDGFTDAVFVSSDKSGDLLWRTVFSRTSQLESLGTIGRSGDNIIISNWVTVQSSSSVPTSIGVVSARDIYGKGQNTPITWSIAHNNQTLSFTFGTAGDMAISGADFNGNGIGDAAVISKAGRKAIWELRFDPFAEGFDSRQFELGNWSDTHFYASLNGQYDSLGVVGKGKNKNAVVTFLDPLTGILTIRRRFPSLFISRGISRPQPIRREDGTVDLFISRKRGREIQTYVYSTMGRIISKKNLPAGGELVVGDYLADPGQEIGIPKDDALTLFNPYTGALQNKLIARGIVVDVFNINRINRQEIKPAPAPENNHGSRPENGDNKNPPSESVNSCQRVAPFPGSHIYKTLGSTHFAPGDVRRNTIGLVVRQGGQGPFPNCVTVVDKSGALVAKMGLYSRGNGWAARWYAGFGCGVDTPLNGAAVAAAAKANSGSTDIYFNFESVCYGPIDARQCIGSSQC